LALGAYQVKTGALAAGDASIASTAAKIDAIDGYAAAAELLDECSLFNYRRWCPGCAAYRRFASGPVNEAGLLRLFR